MDQTYVDGSDHGYVNFYVCNGNCDFFDKYEKNKNIKIDDKDRILYHNVQEFEQSPKIIKANYYRKLKKYILKFAVNGVVTDGVVLIDIFDTNEKNIFTGTIRKNQYLDFKNEIFLLNKKYNVSIEKQKQIGLYFYIVENRGNFQN